MGKFERQTVSLSDREISWLLTLRDIPVCNKALKLKVCKNRQLKSGEKSALYFDLKSTDSSSEEQANNIWNFRVDLNDSEKQNKGKILHKQKTYGDEPQYLPFCSIPLMHPR